MDFRSRRRLVLGSLFVAALALLTLWALRPDVDRPRPAETAESASGSALKLRTTSDQTAPPATSPSEMTPLPASGTLRGRVLDVETHAPIREFQVQFHQARGTSWRRDTPEARTFRSKDGTFEWREAPAGLWMITVSAPGYQRFELEHIAIERESPTTELLMPMRRGHSIRGRVYDERTGIGIASAHISFREANVQQYEGNFRARPFARSSKDGTFMLDGVPAGRITMDVNARDHASRHVDVLVSEATWIDVALTTGGTISGRLTASDRVTVVPGTVGLFNFDTETGSYGRSETGGFEFKQLSAGRYRLRGDAHGAIAIQDITLASGQIIEGIVLAVGSGSTIRGVVTGLRPLDYQRLSLSIRSADASRADIANVEVDAQGGFITRGVPPGRVTIVADVNMRRQLRREAEVPAEGDITVDLHFPAGVRLSGRVTRGGQPNPGISVGVLPVAERDLFIYGTSTSADGRYEIVDIPPGEYRVSIGAFSSRPLQVATDTTFDYEIPTGIFEGIVLEERGDVPVVDASVDVWSTPSKGSGIRFRSRSNHVGQFALTGLEPGNFMISIYRPGYGIVREQIAFPTRERVSTFRLRQDRGVEIRARDARTRKPIDTIVAEEVALEGTGMRLRLQLDMTGTGFLPSGLAGSTLKFHANDFAPITLPNWRGGSIDLNFEREATR